MNKIIMKGRKHYGTIENMIEDIDRQESEIKRLREELQELEFLKYEGGPQSVASIEASLRAMLELHIAHHNHPIHAEARSALGDDT